MELLLCVGQGRGNFLASSDESPNGTNQTRRPSRTCTMALEELHSTVSKLSFNLFGSETEKRVRFVCDNEQMVNFRLGYVQCMSVFGV